MEDKDMIVIYAECLVKAQMTDTFVGLAKQLIEESRKEQGNVSYELIHSREGKNIYAFLEAQRTGKSQHFFCAIGDTEINGIPYSEIVKTAKEYIDSIGGFEKLGEWGLW